MKPLVWLALIIPACAQEHPAQEHLSQSAQAAVDVRSPLEEIADKRASEWDALAKGLEGKIARMLPCDPRVRGALEEVSRASEARLTALSQYLESAAAQSKNDVEKARTALAVEQAAAKDAETERVEAEQQRAAIDGQIADLAQSAKRRQALDEARKKLDEIHTKVDQRLARAQEETARRAALTASLQQLAAGYEARQKAIAGELSALASETARWNEYYAARLGRAQTECSITNRAPAQRKKQ